MAHVESPAIPSTVAAIPVEFFENWSAHLKMEASIAADWEPLRSMHKEGLAHVKHLAGMLVTVFEQLHRAAGAISPEIASIARNALARHYIEVGKEYGRAGKGKKPHNLHTRLEGLLGNPEFRREFAYRKALGNHERLATTPAMIILNDALQRDFDSPLALWTSARGADSSTEEVLWIHTVFPAVQEHWPELAALHLNEQKRRTLGCWRNRLRDAWKALWAEYRLRYIHNPTMRGLEPNESAAAAKALQQWRECATPVSRR